MQLKNTVGEKTGVRDPKKMITIATLLLATLTANAQMRLDASINNKTSINSSKDILIDNNARISGNGTIQTQGHWINDKGSDVFTPIDSNTVIINGTTAQKIAGNTPTNFSTLDIDNTTGVELLQNQSIKNQLIFQQGLLDLNGHNIDLRSTGTLVGESNTARATDIVDEGTITAIRNFNTPNNQDPAHLRLNITSPDNLGQTTIVRGHTQKVSTSGFGTYLRYVVTPTNTPTAVTNKITYFDNELAGIPETDLDQRQKNGSIREQQNGVVNINNNIVTAASAGFGDTLTLGGVSNNPLPVTWADDFETSCQDGIVNITRSVYTEINNAGFQIEHSTDGMTRQATGFVPSHASNSNTPQSYSFQDTIDPVGTSYYRIKQIDNDGQFEYSKVFGSYCEPIDTRSISVVYPNPTSDKIYITVLDNQIHNLPITLSNTLGQKLLHRDEKTVAGSKMLSIDLSIYAVGTYFVTIGDQTQKIIKQ